MDFLEADYRARQKRRSRGKQGSLTEDVKKAYGFGKSAYELFTHKKRAAEEARKASDLAAAKEGRKIAMEKLTRKIKAEKDSAERAKLRIAKARLKTFKL